METLRVVIFGAGTAGIAIADRIRDAIAVEGTESKQDACKQVWCVDRMGLILTSQSDISPAQRLYAKDDDEWSSKGTSLLDVVREVKPQRVDRRQHPAKGIHQRYCGRDG